MLAFQTFRKGMGIPMEYTVQKLARIAGVSARTLRYYDQIGLLRPVRINSSGYRIYGETEVDALQQILFYRAMDVDLNTISRIMNAGDFNRLDALQAHRESLTRKRAQLDTLIATLDKTISSMKGETTMTDKEKFEGFKHDKIEENEKKYGKEIREKYGDGTVDRSNRKFMNMTQEQYNRANALAEGIAEALKQAMTRGDAASSELAQQAADMHRQWLSLYWDTYTHEAHAGVAQMYVDDERFTAYYDKEIPGTAAFLRDAVRIYTGMDPAGK